MYIFFFFTVGNDGSTKHNSLDCRRPLVYVGGKEDCQR